jgi:hypothetical protein
MGNKVPKPIPARGVTLSSKQRLCVAGFTLSHHTNRAATLARTLAALHPEKYETWFYFDNKGYREELLKTVKSELSEEQKMTFSSHRSSPFCWIETQDEIKALGGRDKFCEWAIQMHPETADILALASAEPRLSEIWVDETPGTSQK